MEIIGEIFLEIIGRIVLEFVFQIVCHFTGAFSKWLVLTPLALLLGLRYVPLSHILKERRRTHALTCYHWNNRVTGFIVIMAIIFIATMHQ